MGGGRGSSWESWGQNISGTGQDSSGTLKALQSSLPVVTREPRINLEHAPLAAGPESPSPHTGALSPSPHPLLHRLHRGVLWGTRIRRGEDRTVTHSEAAEMCSQDGRGHYLQA